MADGTLNLTVPRSEKSVWDAPSSPVTFPSYDQERWLAGASGAALAVIGVKRGGFGGAMMAAFGIGLATRAVMGRRDLRVARAWINRTLKDRGWRESDVVEDASADSFPASDAPSWTADSGATINR